MVINDAIIYRPSSWNGIVASTLVEVISRLLSYPTIADTKNS
jgi:hypothetical protein